MFTETKLEGRVVDVHRKLKEALFGMIGSVQSPVVNPARESAEYGGVRVDTPAGPKVAYLRLSFEDPQSK